MCNCSPVDLMLKALWDVRSNLMEIGIRYGGCPVDGGGLTSHLSPSRDRRESRAALITSRLSESPNHRGFGFVVNVGLLVLSVSGGKEETNKRPKKKEEKGKRKRENKLKREQKSLRERK